ncbi:hypothetical protein Tco_0512308, partial [Tanacetum coccineum]
MHEDFEYVKSLENEVDELESEKADFSNMYDLLIEDDVSKDVTCSYLHSLSDLNAYAELQCLYLHKVKECECLAQKLSKQTESVNNEVHNKLLKSFAKLEKHSISLELSLQHCKEQMKNNPVCKENASNSVETQFDKPSVVRQPNAQRIPKPSVLRKPTPFSNSPEMRSFQTKQSVNKTNAVGGMYRIATTTTQNREPQLPHASRNTNPHVSKSSGVNHTTSVSRPQLKCYQVKDKVVPNNSQVKFKKKEVEDHHRISSISKKTKSVTACNDSSNSRTSNVNAVCDECGKCVFNSNHDACVSRYLNDVNARTKKPNVVPISASKPKRKANKSVATPHKKTFRPRSSRTKWCLLEITLQAPFLNVQMMSDHNSSDLAPQRQEMSVENVSSGLVPQGQKASDYDNSDPVPPRQNVVPSAEKPDSSHQGLEFLFSPLLEEYYNPTHDQAEENNNDQAPNASFRPRSSSLVPQGQKASDYDNSDPVPPRQNVVP